MFVTNAETRNIKRTCTHGYSSFQAKATTIANKEQVNSIEKQYNEHTATLNKPLKTLRLGDSETKSVTFIGTTESDNSTNGAINEFYDINFNVPGTPRITSKISIPEFKNDSMFTDSLIINRDLYVRGRIFGELGDTEEGPPVYGSTPIQTFPIQMFIGTTPVNLVTGSYFRIIQTHDLLATFGMNIEWDEPNLASFAQGVVNFRVDPSDIELVPSNTEYVAPLTGIIPSNIGDLITMSNLGTDGNTFNLQELSIFGPIDTDILLAADTGHMYILGTVLLA